MSTEPDGFAMLMEVRGKFASSEQMQDAISKLSVSGFDRADLSLPSPDVLHGTETPEAGTKVAATEADARQMRTLGASTAATAAALAAAGITVATGGATAPAVVAAAVAGSAAGGSVFAVHTASGKAEQDDRDARAERGDLVLAVRSTTETKRRQAEAILRASGATGVEIIS